MDFKKIIIPEEDVNTHLYLGYLGFHGWYDVLSKLRNDEKLSKMKERFVKANKNNREVMDYMFK